MKLMIGGACQGKKAEAQKRYGIQGKNLIDGENCGFQEIFVCKGICHFHVYIKRMLEAEMETGGLIGELKRVNPDILIICNELGCGVVPMDKGERIYRETTGRVCCQAAEASEEVVRVICGIGMVIKHA